MGNYCDVCVETQGHNYQIYATADTFPHTDFAYEQQIRYQSPSWDNQVYIENISEIDEQIQRGSPLQSHYIIPYDIYYIGQWKYGKPHGLGQIKFKNGSLIRGTFKNGYAFGQDCIFVLPDGSYYRGNIDKNKFQGLGVLNQKNGHIYKGYWRDNIPNGDGKQTYENGDTFQGRYRNGRKQGLDCLYIWKDSNQYEWYKGGFKHDYFYGMGEMKKKDGTIIKGQFDGDSIQKALVKNDTYYYEGNVFEGLLDGKGVINLIKSGNEYEGQFLKGQIHGKGVMKFKNGSKKEGIWFNGRYLDQLKGFSYQQAQQNLKIFDQTLQRVNTFEQLLKKINNKFSSKRKAQIFKQQHKKNNKVQVIQINKKLICFYQ